MPQEQIKGKNGALGPDGSLDAFTVTGQSNVTPYSVSGVFDGTGAAGAFLPCLTFKSSTGAIIARCPAPEVAAGDSAAVSWFPHVAQAAAPSPSALPAYVDFDPAPFVADAGTILLTSTEVCASWEQQENGGLIEGYAKIRVDGTGAGAGSAAFFTATQTPSWGFAYPRVQVGFGYTQQLSTQITFAVILYSFFTDVGMFYIDGTGTLVPLTPLLPFPYIFGDTLFSGSWFGRLTHE